MSTYIIAIAAEYVPDHWKIAAEHGFWDMRTGPHIELGDEVVFWASRASIIARVRVTGTTRPLTGRDRLPWHDGSTGGYRKRFTFDVLSDRPKSQPTWTELKEATGIRGIAHSKPRVRTAQGEDWIARQFA